MVYRQELYGYSVYDITNDKEFRYYPQCVLDGKEYFIWTDVYYNPINNFLAVSGCIWACPWGTLLVDFFDPMKPPAFQLDVLNHLDGGYDRYDDSDFIGWEGENLVLECYDTEVKARKGITISGEEYNKWIEKK